MSCGEVPRRIARVDARGRCGPRCGINTSDRGGGRGGAQRREVLGLRRQGRGRARTEPHRDDGRRIRLSQDRGGLLKPMHLLRDPLDTRQNALPHHGEHSRRGARALRDGNKGALHNRAGHNVLRHRPVRQACAFRASRKAACGDRFPVDTPALPLPRQNNRPASFGHP